QAPHGFCDPHVRLGVSDARSKHGCCYKACSGKDADEESVLSIHCDLRCKANGQRLTIGSARIANKSEIRNFRVSPADGIIAARVAPPGVRRFPSAAM